MDRDSLELRSTVTADGTLRLNLEKVSLPEPGPGQVLVRVEAAPITRKFTCPAIGPTPSVSRKVPVPSKRSTKQAILDVPMSRMPITPRCRAARRMFRIARCV